MRLDWAEPTGFAGTRGQEAGADSDGDKAEAGTGDKDQDWGADRVAAWGVDRGLVADRIAEMDLVTDKDQERGVDKDLVADKDKDLVAHKDAERDPIPDDNHAEFYRQKQLEKDEQNHCHSGQ